MVTKTLKQFCQAPDPLSWFSSEQYKKKNRKRSLSIEHQETIKEFWHGKTRPTGDKRDIIRKRIGYKTYLSRPRQILEITQTEFYNDFIVEHSEVKVSQRCFEKFRPYYVKPATKKDRMSCLCHIQVEANMVFKAFMRLRCRLLGKQFGPEKDGNTEATDNEDHEPIENVKIY